MFLDVVLVRVGEGLLELFEGVLRSVEGCGVLAPVFLKHTGAGKDYLNFIV
jgi:hypothetical protein